MEKPRHALPGLFRERGRFFAVSYFLLAPGNELSPAGSPTWLRPGAELVLGLVAPGMELSLAGAPVVAAPFFIFVLAGASVLIPVQAAHHYEMMSPAVTE
jgi:hypothetical protein